VGDGAYEPSLKGAGLPLLETFFLLACTKRHAVQKIAAFLWRSISVRENASGSMGTKACRSILTGFPALIHISRGEVSVKDAVDADKAFLFTVGPFASLAEMIEWLRNVPADESLPVLVGWGFEKSQKAHDFHGLAKYARPGYFDAVRLRHPTIVRRPTVRGFNHVSYEVYPAYAVASRRRIGETKLPNHRLTEHGVLRSRPPQVVEHPQDVPLRIALRWSGGGWALEVVVAHEVRKEKW
jgi:hypothetical protein